MMTRKNVILAIVLLALVAAGAGCIGTTTQTVTHTTTTTKTVTTTTTNTTTSTVTTTVTTTTTTTETYTTYVTLTTEENLYNNVVVLTTQINSFSSTVYDGTTTLYIPTDYLNASDFLKVIYSIMNPAYYSYLDSIWQENGLPPLPTGTDIMEYFDVRTYFTQNFFYDSLRAAKDTAVTSYFPQELIEKKSGICGDYAVMYAAWYLAHSHTVRVHIILFDNYDFGHVWIDNGYEGFEDQYIGIDTEYVSAYWYNVYGPYGELILTIGPEGVIGWTKTHVTKAPSLPVPVGLKKITYTEYITYGPEYTVTAYGYYNEPEMTANFTEYTYVPVNNTLELLTITKIASSTVFTIIMGTYTSTTTGKIQYFYPPELPYIDIEVFTHTLNIVYGFPSYQDGVTIIPVETANGHTITINYTLEKNGATTHIRDIFIYQEIQ